MEERDIKTELLVGLFLFVGLLLLAGLILEFSSIREHFKKSYTITAPFHDASGIKEGSPVVLGGARIGKVAYLPRLNKDFNGVIVTMNIYDDKKIPVDAKFDLGTAGLLGDAFIEIKTSGKSTTNYLEPDTIVPSENVAGASGLTALQDTAQDVGKKVDLALEDLRAAVGDVRIGIKKLNDGVLSDETSRDVKATLAHLNKIITRMDEKIFNDETSADIKKTLASLREAAESIDKEAKRLGPTLEKLNPVLEKADKAVADADVAIKSIDKGVIGIQETVRDIHEGKGLLPALIGDEKLKDEFSMLVSNLRQRGILFYSDKAGQERRRQEDERNGTPHKTGSWLFGSH